MIEALAFALKYFGLISEVIHEGIVIGPEIVKLVTDGYAVTSKIFSENRVPTQDEVLALNTQEEYWRQRLQSDDDLT